MLWVHGTGTHLVDTFLINKWSDLFIVKLKKSVDLVGCAETIEEVHEWNSHLDCGEVRDSTKIVNFLDIVGAHHWNARGAACINIRVIIEDGHTTIGNSTGSNVDNSWGKLLDTFVHVWDHKKKTLG